jgi:hypothetical protein
MTKNTEISNFMNICSLGTELFRADRRTDMTTLIVTSRNVSNVPRLQSNVLSVFKKTRRCLWTEMARKIQSATDIVKIDWTSGNREELRLHDSNTVSGRQLLL